MNVWFVSNDNDWEKPIIDYFVNNGIWNNVIWTSRSKGDKKYSYISHLYDMNFQEYMKVPKDLYDRIYKHLYIAMDMYSRNSPLGQDIYDQKNIHDYLNIFNLVVNFYYKGFTEEKIQLVLMNRAPHSGHDYMSYIVAKEMGIKTLILEQSIFPNQFFYYWEQFDYGIFETSKELFQHNKIEFESKFEKDLFYMKKDPISFKELLRKVYHSNNGRLLRELLLSKQKGQAFYRYDLRKLFVKNKQRIVSNDIDIDNEPFVYFGLHLQPEKTTSSWGGKYCDQLLALEDLSKILPNGWKIYVKENPKQSFFMRGEWFYKRLSLIPNVKVVPNNTNTYSLLKKCKLASTITGTLGWEAITGGKPVLIFGWGTWYKTFPGVFEYREDLDLEKISNTKVDIKLVNDHWNKLSKRMATGVIYNKGGSKGYSAIVEGYTSEGNIENIKQSLKKIMTDVS